MAIGPELGTVGPQLIREAAKEAVKVADLLVVCGFVATAAIQLYLVLRGPSWGQPRP